MNLQTHMSGQFSGQVPNQPVTSMSAVPHQQTIMQNSGVQRSTLQMDPSLFKARRFIQERIFKFLTQRQQTQEIPSKKMMDIVRRLEEGLFKTATTKDEYLNIDTLESRLHILIKRLPLNNHNQQYQQQGNTSVHMIPNPGMPQNGNSSLTVPSSMDNMVPPAVNTGNFLPNVYQQSTASFSNNSVGNSLISSMGAQRMASQMIPTPGFTNNNNNNNNNNNYSTSNQSYMNMDYSHSAVGMSTIDSSTISQPLQQKQQVGSQNSLGSHMGWGNQV